MFGRRCNSDLLLLHLFLLLKNTVDIKITKRFHLRLACDSTLKNDLEKCYSQILLFKITTKSSLTKIPIKIPTKRQRVGQFKNFSLPTIMIKGRIVAFDCHQKPLLLVTSFVPWSIISLLQLNPLFLQLNLQNYN